MVVIPKFRLSNQLAMKLDEMARFEGVSFDEMVRRAVQREYADFLLNIRSLTQEAQNQPDYQPDDEMPF